MDQYYVDPRWKTTEGVVIDIGCLYWDWSRQFAGHKEIIGIDPIEKSCPPWAKLIRKVVSISSGRISMGEMSGCGNSIVFRSQSNDLVDAISLSDILMEHAKICILKMNIEGSEYPLLMSVSHPIADQLVVSFHDDSWAKGPCFSRKATAAIVSYLSNWYVPIDIFPECKWVLFLKGNK